MSALCATLGMIRANYYKVRRKRAVMKVDEAHVERIIQAERAVQPGLGDGSYTACLPEVLWKAAYTTLHCLPIEIDYMPAIAGGSITRVHADEEFLYPPSFCVTCGHGRLRYYR